MKCLQEPLYCLSNFSVDLKLLPQKSLFKKNTVWGRGANHEEKKWARAREEGGGHCRRGALGGPSEGATCEKLSQGGSRPSGGQGRACQEWVRASTEAWRQGLAEEAGGPGQAGGRGSVAAEEL